MPAIGPAGGALQDPQAGGTPARGNRRIRWLALAAVLACGTAGAAEPPAPPIERKVMSFKLSSTAFAADATIPARHTCDGADLSPPLAWTGLPAGTQSLALIVDDPDAPDPAAPRMTWVHWVLYNLPPLAAALPEGVAPADLPAGTRLGRNDWQRTGYGGPCPPVGRHRYVHKLFALDTVLPDLHQPSKAALEKAMQGHVLGRAELVGLYARGR